MQFAAFFGCITLLLVGLAALWLVHTQRQRAMLADQRVLDRTAELVAHLARDSSRLTALARQAVATGDEDLVAEFRETARSSSPQGPQVVPAEPDAATDFIDDIQDSLERLRDMDSTLKRADYDTLASGFDDASWLLERDMQALESLEAGIAEDAAKPFEILHSEEYNARRRSADEHFKAFLASLDIRLYAIKERLERELAVNTILGTAVIGALLVLIPYAGFTLHRQVSGSLAFLRLQVRKINDELARTLSQLDAALRESERKGQSTTGTNPDAAAAEKTDERDDLITRLP